MARARARTSLAASSRESAPATVAATISPSECPATRSGTTPSERQSSDRAYSNAKSVVWAQSVRSSASASSPHITDRSGRGSSRSKRSATRSSASRKTVHRAARKRPIPRRCDPCPGKRSATRGRASPARPVATDPPAPRPANASSRRAISPEERPTTASRSGKCTRWTAAVRHASRSSRSEHPARCFANRPACARSAAGPFPERTRTTGPSCGISAAGVSRGASSRTTWAFVPLIPKELTPARRTLTPRGHGAARERSARELPSQSTCGLGGSAWSVRGRSSRSSESTTLITPAIPAAHWACAMFDFEEPTRSGVSPDRPGPKTAPSAPASIGSPSAVPVPWASTKSMSPGARPEISSARRITRSWEGPFGAVSPWLRPSWLTALPRRTARTRCPFEIASESLSRTTTPQPSLQPVPSAAAPKLLHRPSRASAFRRLNSTNGAGVVMTVTPPASARSHSPPRSAVAARWSATRLDEQAVSTVSAGPTRPRT